MGKSLEPLKLNLKFEVIEKNKTKTNKPVNSQTGYSPQNSTVMLSNMVVKMIQNLGNRMEKKQEMFNKDLEELKSKQTMMNNTINEIKNSLEGISSRITEAEEWK